MAIPSIPRDWLERYLARCEAQTSEWTAISRMLQTYDREEAHARASFQLTIERKANQQRLDALRAKAEAELKRKAPNRLEDLA